LFTFFLSSLLIKSPNCKEYSNGSSSYWIAGDFCSISSFSSSLVL